MARSSSAAGRLQALLAEGADLGRRQFRGADLRGLTLEHADLQGINLSGANLARSSLVHCDFTGANLAGANLSGSRLSSVCFVDADLRNANLTEAYLDEIELDGARLGGARFDGCFFFPTIEFAEDQLSHGGRVGPAARRLDELARSMRLRTRATVRLNKAPIELVIDRKVLVRHSWSHLMGTVGMEVHGRAPSVLQALIRLANTWGRGRLDPKSVTVRPSTSSPIKGQEVADLTRAAWCEVFGVAIPRNAAYTPFKTSKEQREEFLALLRGGQDGIERWKLCEEARVELRNFRLIDLSNQSLARARFDCLDLGGACLDGADLRKASFSIWITTFNEKGGSSGRAGKPCSLKRASLKGADLREAFMSGCHADEARFDDAQMGKARMVLAKLRKASFQGTDLRGADLYGSDLRGADLSTARLDGTDLGGVILDEKTRFPRGFRLPEHFKWKGQGSPPVSP